MLIFLFRKLWYTTSIQTQSIYIHICRQGGFCTRVIGLPAAEVWRDRLASRETISEDERQASSTCWLHTYMYMYDMYMLYALTWPPWAWAEEPIGCATMIHDDPWRISNEMEEAEMSPSFWIHPACGGPSVVFSCAPGKWTGKLLYKFKPKYPHLICQTYCASGSWKLWPSSGGDPQVLSDEPGWDSWKYGPTVCIKLHDMGHWDRWKF